MTKFNLGLDFNQFFITAITLIEHLSRLVVSIEISFKNSLYNIHVALLTTIYNSYRTNMSNNETGSLNNLPSCLVVQNINNGSNENVIIK